MYKYCLQIVTRDNEIFTLWYDDIYTIIANS